MALCTTLRAINKPHIEFDPFNAEHLEAFKMLCLGEKGPESKVNQHPTLRFVVDLPFDNVRAMMLYRVSEAHVKQIRSANVRGR